MKKYKIMPLAILGYAIVMAIYSYRQIGSWTTNMTITLLVELVVVILLYFFLKKRGR